jgi:hypothetical protein
MKDLVEFLARSVVAEPDAVSVEEFDDGGELVLEVRVAEDDLGRVIGKDGRVAKAIRTIARAAGARDGRRVAVEIVEAD